MREVDVATDRLLLVTPFTAEALARTWQGEWPLVRAWRDAGFWTEDRCALVPLPSPSRSAGGLARTARALAGLLRRVWRGPATVVVWHGGLQMLATTLVVAVARLCRRPVRLVLLGWEWPGWAASRSAGRLQRLARAGAFATSDQVICHSRGQLESTRTFSRPWTRSAPRLDRVRYAGPKALPDVPHPAEAAFVFTSGGNNRDTTTALAGIEQAGVTATVVAPPAGARAAAGVRLVPRVSFPEYDGLLAACRVVVIALRDPDVSSGQLGLIHATARGRALVITGFTGVEDYVEDGVDAIVVPPGDADALGRALRRLHDDEELRRRLAEAAGRAFEDRFGWPAYAARLREVLEQRSS